MPVNKPYRVTRNPQPGGRAMSDQGLEHMGDVWALLSKWERLLKDTE